MDKVRILMVPRGGSAAAEPISEFLAHGALEGRLVAVRRLDTPFETVH
jgi:hypothetical protein